MDSDGPWGIALAPPASALFEPFASFAADVHVKFGPQGNENDDRFDVNATVGLGAGSDGINPLTENVTLGIGAFSTVVPAGLFKPANGNKNDFEFDGQIKGVTLKVTIQSLFGGFFSLKAQGRDSNLGGTINPVPVKLAIGNDSGSVVVTAQLTPRN